ncbi:MAG: hypothetical protein PWP51_1167 [Clostridiales bacterium]|nr:hypothetical protein [Clostridiales bacterium]MDN5298614.1 hypothetical protein [Clostridiales bacterium]
MEVYEKLRILADAAKYDVSCASSGHQRGNANKQLGSTAAAGICHSWSEDGRCISLLKILYTNHCIYNCAYCVNRSSNDVKRAAFTPEEVVSLTINFYRRNYIEGLFLSSGIIKSPNHTMQRLIEVVKQLRTREGFNGYIHLKGIPGADEGLINEAGLYVDRMSYNLELPTTKGLRLLAPEKERKQIIMPMQQVRDQMIAYRDMKKHLPSAPSFIPAGQSTQMIVGATDETDYHIIKIAEAMYNRLALKRVYYSAFVPGSTHPAVVERGRPPLNREHRIYQADWLLRFYGFKADEILTPDQPQLDLLVDPKCQWALNHMAYFPMEVNRVPYAALLRIPGIGVISARRIVNARRFSALSYDDLKGMGVVLKRAKYFITCKGKYCGDGDVEPVYLRQKLLEPPRPEQISLFQTHPEVFDESEAIIRGLLT